MFLNQLIWKVTNKPPDYQEEVVIPEALMVECFTKLCKIRQPTDATKGGEQVKEGFSDYSSRIVSSTNGSIVNDIFGQETYLLWQNVLVLRKNIYPFLKKITNIDAKFKGEKDPSRISEKDKNI